MVEKLKVINDYHAVMFEVQLPERYVHIATLRGLVYDFEGLCIKWVDLRTIADEDN